MQFFLCLAGILAVMCGIILVTSDEDTPRVWGTITIAGGVVAIGFAISSLF